MRTFIIAGLISLAPLSARAADDSWSGNRIRAGCQSQIRADGSNAYTSGLCMGVVAGLSWAMSATKVACFPASATFDQGIRVVLKYMAANPEETHEDFKVLTIRAFKQTWPCRESEAPTVQQNGRVY